MRKFRSLLVFWGLTLIIYLFLAGCGSSATSTPLPILTSVLEANVGVGSATLSQGERAQIPIAITDIENPGGLGAYDFRVTFDPSMVQVVAVSGGDPPFGSGEIGNLIGGMPIHRINNQEGWVTLVAFQALMIPGPMEDTVVAYVEVEAIGSSGSTSPLNLHVRGLPEAVSGEDILTAVFNGSISIR